ncbi:MAG: NUMOD4 domain-containing protein [Anaerobutyricum sp.]
MKEIWKDINNYEGIYQCSNLGRIRSLDRYVYEHSGKKQFRKGQIMKLRLNPNGYFQVPLNKNGKKKDVFCSYSCCQNISETKM